MSEPDDLFPPRPGGMVDTIRKQAQAEQDQITGLLAAEPGETGPAGQAYDAVRVRPEPADSGNIRTLTLSAAYPVAQALPGDPQRRSAYLLAVDSDVYVTRSEGLAHDVAGTASAGQAGYLPKGIVYPIPDQSPYWIAATTTTATSRVTVSWSRDSGEG